MKTRYYRLLHAQKFDSGPSTERMLDDQGILRRALGR